MQFICKYCRNWVSASSQELQTHQQLVSPCQEVHKTQLVATTCKTSFHDADNTSDYEDELSLTDTEMLKQMNLWIGDNQVQKGLGALTNK